MNYNKDKLQEILNSFVTKFHGSDDGWYKALERICERCRYDENVLEVTEDIRSWFGGMGSFSDVRLGKTDDERLEFDYLQSELYKICFKIIIEARGVIE